MPAPLFFDNAIVHFRCFNTYPPGITPLEPVPNGEVKRAFYKDFAGVRFDGVITPNVDWTRSPGIGAGATSTEHFTVVNDSTRRFEMQRNGLRRTFPLIAGRYTSGFPATTQISPVYPPESDVSLSTQTDAITYPAHPPDDYTDVLDVQLAGWNLISTPIGFLRSGQTSGLCMLWTLSSALTRLFIYAPVVGATPEDFYGFPTQPADTLDIYGNPALTYTAIAEYDFDTLFGITIKAKGWSASQNRTADLATYGYDSSGVEEYTPSATMTLL